VLLIVLLLLSACGGDTQDAPRLSAPPTRTPEPATEEVVADEAGVENIQIVSLRSQIDAFLTAAEAVGPLERVDVFSQTVIAAAPECWKSTLWPNWQALEQLNAMNVNLTEVDMAAWRATVDAFPEEDLMRQTVDILRQARAELPLDQTLTVCLAPMPLPHFFGPNPEELPNSGLSLSSWGDMIYLGCQDSARCGTQVEADLAYAYATAYQFVSAGRLGDDIPLLSWVVTFGRSAVFAHQLVPDATFQWDTDMTPEVEADVWARMQEYLNTTYNDYPGYRNVDYFLYGRDGRLDQYPRFGGFYIGERIVRAYQESHPNVSFADLMALDASTLVADSGYTP
jgi:hypothetical protein